MVVAALKHAEANMLKKNAAAVDLQKQLERQPSSSLTDVPQLVAAHQAVSDESRQLVSAALDHAHGDYMHHRCTFEAHSPRPAAQQTHPVNGTLRSVLNQLINRTVNVNHRRELPALTAQVATSLKESAGVWTVFHGDHPPRKRGKVGEFDIGQGKVWEIVVCLRCATAVAIVTK